MGKLRMLWARVKGQAAQGREDEAFDEEVREHIALLEKRFRAQGMSAGDAARAARRQFGNVTALKETAAGATRDSLTHGMVARRAVWRADAGQAAGVKRGGGAGAGAGNRNELRGVHVCERDPAAASAGSTANAKDDRAVAEASEADRPTGLSAVQLSRLHVLSRPHALAGGVAGIRRRRSGRDLEPRGVGTESERDSGVREFLFGAGSECGGGAGAVSRRRPHRQSAAGCGAELRVLEEQDGRGPRHCGANADAERRSVHGGGRGAG